MGAIINVGIIGMGRSGRDIHGNQILKSRKKFCIKAVADKLPERQERARQEYGCDAYANWQSLLNRDDIDLIVNASPTHMHVPISIQCLEAGFHVLCEKPLGRKVSEVDKVIRTAKKARRHMAVFQNRRHLPSFQQTKKVLESGVLGRIVLIKDRACNFKRRWDWQTSRKHYGGSLLNTGSHNLDHLLQLFGSDVMPKVTCIMDRTSTYGDAEDHVKLILQGRGRPTVDLELSSCCAYPAAPFVVYGSRGGLRATDRLVEWKYFEPGKQTKQKLTFAPLSDEQGNPAYCSDKLKWKEKSWTWSKPDPHGYSTMKFYAMLHRTLTTRARLEVTLEEVRQQIAVIEECHRQNPPSKMPKADLG